MWSPYRLPPEHSFPEPVARRKRSRAPAVVVVLAFGIVSVAGVRRPSTIVADPPPPTAVVAERVDPTAQHHAMGFDRESRAALDECRMLQDVSNRLMEEGMKEQSSHWSRRPEAEWRSAAIAASDEARRACLLARDVVSKQHSR